MIRLAKNALLLFISLTSLASPALAQSEAESAHGLTIENQRNEKRSIEVQPGEKIAVTLSPTQTYRGYLTSADSSSLQVDSLTFQYAEVEALKIKGNTAMRKKPLYPLLPLTGLGSACLGGIMVIAYFSLALANGGIAIEMLMIAGVVLAYGGLLLILGSLIAIVVIAIGGRRLVQGRKWQLKRGQHMQENPRAKN